MSCQLLLKENTQAEIKIGFETGDIIEEAHQSGLSINRYMLYKSLRNKGISITVEAVCSNFQTAFFVGVQAEVY